MTVINLGIVFIIGVVAALGLYAYARQRHFYAVVDLLWSGGVLALAMWLWVVTDGEPLRAVVALLITAVWSIRLSWHIFHDRVLPGKDDGRYQNLLEHWGDAGPGRFIYVFLAQVPTAFAFSVPIYVAMANPVPGFRWVDGLGVFIALLAVFGERTADVQLASFRQNPANKGRVCQVGLWRYSRHPNYFFEFLFWFSYVALAWGSELFLLSLLGVALMYVFLNYVSGIPHTERQAIASRGDSYREYQQTTSAFFPWIPRKPQA